MSILKPALLIGSFFLIFSLVHCTPSSDEAATAAKRCPKGKVFTSCLPCAGTINCANPNPKVCPLVCIPGCTCAAGTILNEKTGKCVKNCTVPVRSCPRGFVSTQCLSCGGRPLTCRDKANGGFCPLVCVPGCDCPKGKVLDQTTGQCVKKCRATNATQTRCPIKGQVHKQCVECPGNPFTCANPSHPCTRICIPGCECPHGQVLDQKRNKCVRLEQCLY
eukprot:Em0022g874a